MPPKKRRPTPRKRSSHVAPIPTGFHSVTPYLFVRGAAEAIKFYRKAFDAKELLRNLAPDGKILHARLLIGNSIVMVSDQFGAGEPASAESSRSSLHIYTPHVDRLWRQAVAAGAQVQMPLGDMFWGERYGQLNDPFGHAWSISTPIRMSKAERERKEKEAMAQFAAMASPDHSPG